MNGDLEGDLYVFHLHFHDGGGTGAAIPPLSDAANAQSKLCSPRFVAAIKILNRNDDAWGGVGGWGGVGDPGEEMGRVQQGGINININIK